MKPNFSTSKLVVALALCMLLLGGFSVEAAGRINEVCRYGQCLEDYDCTGPCKSHGYSRGSCQIRIFPSSKIDPKTIHVDYDMPGKCCCLH
ncbi:hypothetical protein C5167_027263 [Papaver somniferum]|nr:hypothetical protein C5167_027263 [Papaver somniferum]